MKATRVSSLLTFFVMLWATTNTLTLRRNTKSEASLLITEFDLTSKLLL